MNRNRLLLWFTLALAAICAVVAAVITLLPGREDSTAQPALPAAAPVEKPVKRAGSAHRVGAEPINLVAQVAPKRSAELEALYQLAERDLAAALAEAKRQYASGRWEDVQAALASHVLEKDFSKAPEILALLNSMAMQSSLMQCLPIAFRRDRAGTTAIVFDRLTGKTQEYAAWNIVRTQLEDGDLLAAMQTQLRLPNSSLAEQSALEVASKVQSRDLAAGLRWFEQLSTDSQRKTAHDHIAQNLRKAGDAEGMMQLLAATHPEETIKPGGTRLWNRTSIVRTIANLQHRMNDAAGLEALRAMLPEEEKSFVDVGILYADRDKPLPERFTRAAAFTDMQARSAAISSVISGEVAKNPHQAADFVLGLPDNTFGMTLGSLVQSWKFKDAGGLADWVRNLPAGPRREKAISSFVMAHRHGRGSEKDLAREFAALAADPMDREKLLREIPCILSEKERAAGAR